jgi:probable HAF family extracellular repeat protein
VMLFILLINQSGALALPASPVSVITTVYLPMIYRSNCNPSPGAKYCIAKLNLGNIVSPSGINNTGQIVATVYDSTRSIPRAILWNNGVITDLGTLGGGGAVAHAINQAGHVVGSSTTSTFATHAFLWQNGVMTDLGTFGGAASAATDINNAGQVVGTADTSEKYPNGAFVSHAFLWQNGVMTDLDTPEGPNILPYAINDVGTIIGVISATNQQYHAARRQNGVVTDLGALGGVQSEAHDINASGQIVGYGSSYQEGYAILWQADQAVNLNTQIDPGSGWEMSSAVAINDLGQILGSGLMNGQAAAFLLTPVR